MPREKPDAGVKAREKLEAYLERHHLKHTRQREVILETFLASKGHMTSEDLHDRVRSDHPEIGAATVYRALKLFSESGIASPSYFREGVTMYEHQATHHDHLVCLGCGEIVEFECQMIEEAQTAIALEYGYHLTNHRHDLYGYCRRCRKDGRDR